MTPLDALTRSAHAMLESPDRREVSASELVEATLARIAAVIPVLNATVALDAARAADAPPPRSDE